MIDKATYEMFVANGLISAPEDRKVCVNTMPADHLFEQVLKVKTGEMDGDDFGNEWEAHYVLYHTRDDNGLECWDLYEDDGAGNGTHACRGYNLTAMRSMTLRLGEWVEWGAKDETAP